MCPGNTIARTMKTANAIARNRRIPTMPQPSALHLFEGVVSLWVLPCSELPVLHKVESHTESAFHAYSHDASLRIWNEEEDCRDCNQSTGGDPKDSLGSLLMSHSPQT